MIFARCSRCSIFSRRSRRSRHVHKDRWDKQVHRPSLPGYIQEKESCKASFRKLPALRTHVLHGPAHVVGSRPRMRREGWCEAKLPCSQGRNCRHRLAYSARARVREGGKGCHSVSPMMSRSSESADGKRHRDGRRRRGEFGGSHSAAIFLDAWNGKSKAGQNERVPRRVKCMCPETNKKEILKRNAC